MPHSNESVLSQKEPVKYTNKIKKYIYIKLQNYKNYKTTKKLQKILIVNKTSNTG